MRQSELLRQLATPLNHPFRFVGYPGANGVRLPITDELLLAEAGGTTKAIEEYLGLVLGDAKVNASFNKIVSEITKRDWEVIPASESALDKAIAQDITNVLESLGDFKDTGRKATLHQDSGYNYLTKAAAVSYISGIQPVELIWGKNPKRKPYVQSVKSRDISRFTMFVEKDGTITPRMLTPNQQVDGEEIPSRKIIFMRYWNVGIEDEYGSGLGRQLYYLVSWKKQLMSFWLAYTDRLSQPVAVGKYDPLSRAQDIAAFNTAVSNIGQEMGMVMPNTYDVQFASPGGGNFQLFTELLDYIDRQISLLILGEATTGESVAGSRSKDEISNDIRIMKAKDLSEAIDSTLNSTLIRWLVDVRHGLKVDAPTVSRKFEEEDSPMEFAELITALKNAEIELEPSFVEEKLGMPLKPKRKAIESPQEMPEI